MVFNGEVMVVAARERMLDLQAVAAGRRRGNRWDRRSRPRLREWLKSLFERCEAPVGASRILSPCSTGVEPC